MFCNAAPAAGRFIGVLNVREQAARLLRESVIMASTTSDFTETTRLDKKTEKQSRKLLPFHNVWCSTPDSF